MKTNTFFRTMALVAGLVFYTLSGLGQTPFSASYTFTGTTGNVTSFAYNGVIYDGIVPGDIVKVGVTSSSSTGNFRATNWPLGATNGSNVFTGSVDFGKYIGFTIDAATGYKFTVTSITFGVGRSGTGIRQSQWRGSDDGFGSVLNNYTNLHAGLANDGGILTNPDENSNWTGNTLTLGTEYSEITDVVEFRYYLYNAEATAGTAGLQGPITIIGTFELSGGTPMVSLPQFIPPSGNYYSTQFVEISTSTPDATIYYTDDGSDPDNTSTEYILPIEISSTTTLKARAYKPGFDPSNIATAVFTFPPVTDVANIALLRAGAIDGTVYKLTGEAIITFAQTFRNQKFIQDATAAILIDDVAGVIQGSYAIGDGITDIAGTLAVFSGMLQFTPLADADGPFTPAGSITPTVITMQQFVNDFEVYESQLVTIEDVTFTGADGIITFINGSVYGISDGITSGDFRASFFDVDYIGDIVPVLPQHITGILNQREASPIGKFITARNQTDIEAVPSLVDPPDFFTAVTVSSSQVELTFAPNTSADDIVIVYNLTGIFSEPSGDPPAEGDLFAGGVLLYVGIDSLLSHNGLYPAVTYYYRAWSYDKVYYSPGLNANATTYATEPSNHITGLSATANSSSSITVAWTDSDATGYLIKGSDVDFGAITAPTDGVSVADGALIKNVAAGVGSHDFTGLSELTEYFFKIYPYNGSGATINYKTDGTVPQASATTEEAPPTPDVITQWNFNGPSTTEVPGGTSSPIPAIGTGIAALFGGTTALFASGIASGGSSDPVITSPPNYGWNTETYASQGNNSGARGVQFNVSTVGYEDISLNFDLRTSNTSSRWFKLYYTVDGIDYVNLGEPVRLGGMGDNSIGNSWSNQLFADFTSIAAANNNPNFAIRIVSVFSPIAFTEYNSSTNYDANTAYEAANNTTATPNSVYGGGTWRFDMVTFSGFAVDLNLPVKLVVTDVNGGNSPAINNEFNVTVQSQNTDNLPSGVTQNTEVTLTLATGSGTLGGTLTGTILSGQNSVTFTDITYDVAETGVSITATATDGMTLSPDTSAAFEVISPATQLAFVGFPANGSENVAVASFTVEARRSNNSLDPNFTGTITLSKNSGPGDISGTLSAAAINGVATFNNIIFDAAGEYTLAANATGLTQAISTTIYISASPTIAGLIVPQFIGADNPANNRIPFAFRAKLENLIPNSTYKYINQVVIATDGPTVNGAGNPIFVTTAGNFIRTTNPSFTTPNAHYEFTTNSEGASDVWFITEPTTNVKFTPGNEVFMRIRINDGEGGTTAVHYLTISDGIDVLGFGTDAEAAKGTAVHGISAYEPKNFVFLYENEAGTGRPLFGSSIETTGIDFSAISNYAAFYKADVSGVDGAWGGIIPNLNANGVKRIEERSLADASIVVIHTSEDGMWGASNTVNPTGGTTALVIDLTTPEVPENRTVDGITLGVDDIECYDAINNITVTNTNIGNGASVEFRAGVNIIFGDGFISEEGSYVLAIITDVYCTLPASMLASEEIVVPEIQTGMPVPGTTFKVYPNPSSGVFALELSGVENTEKVTVEVFGMMGERLLRSDLSGSQVYQFDMSAMPRGVYILRVLRGDQTYIQKIIRQ